MTTSTLLWALSVPAALFVVYQAADRMHRRDLVRQVARHPETRALRRLEMQR